MFEVSADEPVRQQAWGEQIPNEKFVSMSSPPKSDSLKYEKEMLKGTFHITTGESMKLHLGRGEKFEVSRKLLQHRPRREEHSEWNVPKYIEVVPYRENVKKRLDAIAAGFASLPNPRPRHVQPHRPGYMQLGGHNDDSYCLMRTTKKNKNPKSRSLINRRHDSEKALRIEASTRRR